MRTLKICLFLISFQFVFVLLVDGQEAPKGFSLYKVKSGDTLEKIAPRQHWDLILRVNRIDERHLPAGRNILLPVSEKAETFCPVSRGYAELASFAKVLVIFLDFQYFGAYENGALVFWGPISSGIKNNKTPKGDFKVLWKARHYRSKKYEAEMPFAINFSKEGYFLHKQSLPGRPASHGCVRLLEKDAKKIFEWIKKDDKIIII
ncbi:MAG: L,D-transpeptidase family protein [Candidatus Terrybacteria bacterium]|nr:L,D-transpeptidase family protein [Candidatus Terrybacteria bacterium]